MEIDKITYYDETDRRFKELKNGKVKNAKSYKPKPLIKILDRIYMCCLFAWLFLYCSVLWRIIPKRFRKSKRWM